ncbi:hypothetical protein GQ457_08G024210 [Hibiscus cannabinus]
MVNTSEVLDANGVVAQGSDDASHMFSNKRIKVCLDDTNYLLWKKQVVLTIRGLGLEEFIDPNTPKPVKVVERAGESIVNPAHTRFVKQDSSLASWLLLTVSADVLPQLVGAETSAEIWSVITGLYSKLSTTKIMHLHCKLCSMRKGALHMREYTVKVKEICDLLALSGNKVSEVEHIATILNGLPAEFAPFVAVITASQVPYTLDGVISVLVDVEPRLMDIVEVPIGINLSQVQNNESQGQTEPVPVIPSYQASLDVGLSQGQITTQVRSSSRESTSTTSSADPITSGATVGSGSFPIMTDSGLDDREEGLTARGVDSNEAEVPAIEVVGETVDEAAVYNDEAIFYNDEVVEEEGISNAEIPVDEIPVVDMAAGAANATAEETSNIDTKAYSGSTLVRNTHTMLTRSKCGIFKPKAYLARCDEFPKDVYEALQHADWKTDIDDKNYKDKSDYSWKKFYVVEYRYPKIEYRYPLHQKGSNG